VKVKRMMKKNKSLYIISTLLLILITTCAKKEIAFAAASLNINLGNSQNPNDVSSALQLIIFLTILTLAPSILIMMTSFTRILIVLGFIRNALGTQQMPPNQILIGLALFLTFFVMAPVTDKIYTQAYQPYINGRITSQEALKRAEEPLKEFMLKNTRKKDLDLFVKLSNVNPNTNVKDLPLRVVVPAFIISELKSAFEMGFLIYVPFLIIDMVVASILMSMGMLMIPPVMISLPFKILLFILVDGWNLVIESLVRSFK
jgi:flagellar biosynthetic protein FliP